MEPEPGTGWLAPQSGDDGPSPDTAESRLVDTVRNRYPAILGGARINPDGHYTIYVKNPDDPDVVNLTRRPGLRVALERAKYSEHEQDALLETGVRAFTEAGLGKQVISATPNGLEVVISKFDYTPERLAAARKALGEPLASEMKVSLSNYPAVEFQSARGGIGLQAPNNF